MKFLVLAILLLGGSAQAQWGGVVSGTAHKTDSGKYPYFFDDQGHPEVWDDKMQADYDGKMSATIKELCSDGPKLGELEKEHTEAERIFYSDEKNKNALFNDTERGKKMDALKADIIRLSNIVVKGTGQPAKNWGCQ